MVLITLLLTKLYCDVLVEELINLWAATVGCEQAGVWRTKSVARGSWDALKTHPNLCKPFLSKQRTTGGGNDMIICWVHSLWHSVTTPRPLWKILGTPLEHTRYGPPADRFSHRLAFRSLRACGSKVTLFEDYSNKKYMAQRKEKTRVFLYAARELIA